MSVLFIRSYYSLMRGCSSPEALCARARKLGFSTIVLVDRNSLAGIWDFLKACRKYALCPVTGAEITEVETDRSLICLVRNYTGYINLSNYITKIKKHSNFNISSMDKKGTEGLFLISDSLEILRMLSRKGLLPVADSGRRPTESAGKLRHWARENNIPMVAAALALMAEKKDRDLFVLLQAIRYKQHFAHQLATGELPAYIETPQQYEDRFAVWPEVLPATVTLVEQCTFRGPEFGLVMPPWQKEKGSAAVLLRKKAYAGACIRYGEDLSEAVVERLEHELKIIDSMGFSTYFLVVRAIIHDCFKAALHTVPRICGRGSGAASLVAYCLEITNVCPLKHGLYFERFLNPGRSDPPDIDIDFAWDERDVVLDRVLLKYKNHAAMVATVIRFQLRMAIRETARAFGLTAGEIKTHIKMLRQKTTDIHNLTDPWPQIMQLAAQLVGNPRCLSVHPGGVVITPNPLHHYVPVEQSAKGVPIIQWDKDGAEAAGLVKIDLLGNRSLAVIRDCIASITSGGRNFDEEYWQPEEDERTKRNIAAGKTMGCFYIESPAMRLLQKRANSGDFEQLVLQSSIIRPAANDFVREYVRRLHGGAWQHLHPSLKNVLDETFGLMVYQEDVSRVAVAVAGFSHVQADGLRKVLSKKDKIQRLQDYRERFTSGCRKNGVSPEVCTKLWQMMMSFDGYSFCKAHSASYARVSYQAAYLKSHYPAEFMAAVISNQGGYYSEFAYVSEAKRLGLQVLSPCVNRSTIRWSGRDKELRVGLLSIRDLSTTGMEKIVSNRKGKSYQSCTDFWQRVKLNTDENRALIQAGALDSFTDSANRSLLFWELARFNSLGKMQRSVSLFPLKLPPAPNLAAGTTIDYLRQEYRTLGFLCKEHPLLLYDDRLKGRVQGKNLPKYHGRRITFAGWLISGKIVSTKTGEVMEFLSFEDETALVETVFFPKVYRRYATQLSTGRPYLLSGLVEEEFGATTLTVERLRVLPLTVPQQV